MALALSLFGTLLALWLAVLRRSSRGTLWNALEVRAELERLTLLSSALISNSRALTNFSTSSSPFPNALPEVCEEMVRASWTLARLRFLLDVSVWIDCFRLRMFPVLMFEDIELSVTDQLRTWERDDVVPVMASSDYVRGAW